MKSENYEICHDNMISYVESVIKNWEGFAKVVTYVGYETKYLRRSSIDMRRIHLDFESQQRSNWGLSVSGPHGLASTSDDATCPSP